MVLIEGKDKNPYSGYRIASRNRNSGLKKKKRTSRSIIEQGRDCVVG
jgi:hypothetical protein